MEMEMEMGLNLGLTTLSSHEPQNSYEQQSSWTTLSHYRCRAPGDVNPRTGPLEYGRELFVKLATGQGHVNDLRKGPASVRRRRTGTSPPTGRTCSTPPRASPPCPNHWTQPLTSPDAMSRRPTTPGELAVGDGAESRVAARLRRRHRSSGEVPAAVTDCRGTGGERRTPTQAGDAPSGRARPCERAAGRDEQGDVRAVFEAGGVGELQPLPAVPHAVVRGMDVQAPGPRTVTGPKGRGSATRRYGCPSPSQWAAVARTAAAAPVPSTAPAMTSPG